MTLKQSAFPICLLVLLTIPTVLQAQFTFTTNSGAITITGYTGTSDAVVIPSVVNGLPVTDIGLNAFASNNVTSVTIPDSITNIGTQAFESCSNLTSVIIGTNVETIGMGAFVFCGLLTNVTIPNSVMTIGVGAFDDCASITSVTIPNNVTSVGEGAFQACINITSLTIGNKLTYIGTNAFGACINLTTITFPASLTSIENYAFLGCDKLTSIYFKGNPPSLGGSLVFGYFPNAGETVYYYYGTVGWGPTYGGIPTVMLNAPPSITDVVISDNQFSFSINGSDQQIVVVQTCTNLVNANWQPLQTNTLIGNSFNFTDPGWTNYPSRFYRIQ